MSEKLARFLKSEDIPTTLFDLTEKKLILPADLVSVWKELLADHDLMEMATQKASEGFIGGMSEDDSKKHLAWRFTGSVARVELALLDPESKLGDIPDALIKIFSGGHIALADLPCGSGAASLSILTNIAELRKKCCLPREPLYVSLVGGEISMYARSYADCLLENIQNFLEEQAIWVEKKVMEWDVRDKISNADFIKEFMNKSSNCGARLILISNFSGFLKSDPNWKKAEKQLDNLFVFGRGYNSSVIWIEPRTNEVTGIGGLFEKLIKWWRNSKINILNEHNKENKVNYLCDSMVIHPLQVGGQFHVNLAVERFELNDQSKQIK